VYYLEFLNQKSDCIHQHKDSRRWMLVDYFIRYRHSGAVYETEEFSDAGIKTNYKLLIS